MFATIIPALRVITPMTTVTVVIVLARAMRHEGNEDFSVSTKRVWRAVRPDIVPEGFEDGVPFYFGNFSKQATRVPWGRSVEGTDVNDNWVEFAGAFSGDDVQYLPKKTNGTEILQLLRGEQWECVKEYRTNSTIFNVGDVVEVTERRESPHPILCVEEPKVCVPQVLETSSGPQHILFVRLDILPHTLLGEKKRIGVVGCGIAGIVASLELALRKDVEEIVVMDREEGCARGTSGRIAAEMLFYNSERDLFLTSGLTATAKIEAAWRAVKKAQFSVNWGLGSETFTQLMQFTNLYSERRQAEGKKIKVTCKNLCEGVHFGNSPFGLPVVTNTSLNDLKVNDVLASIDGVFIDALWKSTEGNKSDSEIDKLVKENINRSKTRKLVFRRKPDVRALAAYQAHFFQAAADRLKALILAYPELCEAVITPFCCSQEGAKALVDANQDDWGYNCSGYEGTEGIDAGMGTVSVLMTRKTWENAEAREKLLEETDLVQWNASTTKTFLPSYIGEEEMVHGAAVNRHRSGYVRTEDLGRVFEKIMEDKGHKISRRSELESAIITDDFQVVANFKSSHHDWEDSENIKTYKLREGEGPRYWNLVFHGLMLCTGAAPEYVNKIDDSTKRQLVAAMGNIIVGPPGMVNESDSRLGVVLEEFKMYMRSTKDRRHAIGGGMWIPRADRTSDFVRALPYKQKFHTLGEIHGFDGDAYMRQSAIGKMVVDNPGTLRQGGARPVCHFWNFPLIKLHPFAPVVINTGMGANGFVMAWKSGQIAADLLLTRQVNLGGVGVTPWREDAWSWIVGHESPTYTPPSFYRVIAQKLAVYPVADDKSSPEQLQVQGTEVICHDHADGWLRIVFGDGSAGFIQEKEQDTIKFAFYTVKVEAPTYETDARKNLIHTKIASAGQVFRGSEIGIHWSSSTSLGKLFQIQPSEEWKGYIEMKYMEPCKGLECASRCDN